MYQRPYNGICGLYEGRTVTYQVAMRGSDGVVIASDRQELHEGGSTDEIRKIQIDRSGQFAWAFAGKQFSSLVASSIRRDFEAGTLHSSDDIGKAIRTIATELLPDKAFDETPRSTILWVDGPAKTVCRAELLPKDLTIFTPIENDRCIAGLITSMASLLPEHFYSSDMSVDRLAVLAAYTIWLAHKVDPLCVKGLDIAIYRASAPNPEFEFLDGAEYLQRAATIHEAIRSAFA
jgi:hypothetical protein